MAFSSGQSTPLSRPRACLHLGFFLRWRCRSFPVLTRWCGARSQHSSCSLNQKLILVYRRTVKGALRGASPSTLQWPGSQTRLPETTLLSIGHSPGPLATDLVDCWSVFLKLLAQRGRRLFRLQWVNECKSCSAGEAVKARRSPRGTGLWMCSGRKSTGQTRGWASGCQADVTLGTEVPTHPPAEGKTGLPWVSVPFACARAPLPEDRGVTQAVT